MSVIARHRAQAAAAVGLGECAASMTVPPAAALKTIASLGDGSGGATQLLSNVEGSDGSPAAGLAQLLITLQSSDDGTAAAAAAVGNGGGAGQKRQQRLTRATSSSRIQA